MPAATKKKRAAAAPRAGGARTKQTAKGKAAAAKAPRKSLATKAAKKSVPGVKAKKPHKWRPGTVALREIRRGQKSTDLLIKKAPTVTFIKNELADLGGAAAQAKMQATAMYALREVIQEYVIRLGEAANYLALHAKRVTLFAKDITIARASFGTLFPVEMEVVPIGSVSIGSRAGGGGAGGDDDENDERAGGLGKGKGGKGLGKAKRHQKRRPDNARTWLGAPAIRRLLRRSGVKRIRKNVYDEMRAVVSEHMLRPLIAKMAVYMEQANRKTITIGDVKQASSFLLRNPPRKYYI